MLDDDLTRIMWCLLGSVTASYVEAGFNPLTHTYISQTDVDPVCAAHGFATVKWVGKSKGPGARFTPEMFGFGQQDNGCIRRGMDVFRLRIGSCAPPSPALVILASEGGQCPTQDAYGGPQPCDTDNTIYTPPELPSECVAPIGVNPDTNELVWPVSPTPMTHSEYSRMLIMQAQAVHKHLKTKLCECLASCYQPSQRRIEKSAIRIGSSETWCLGRFAGIELDIAVVSG